MNMDPQDIFTKVSPDESEKLLADLTANQASISLKLQSLDDLLSFQIQGRENGWNLICRLTDQASLPAGTTQEAIVSTQIGAEKYYMTGHLARRSDGLYSLRLEQKIFQLQRRQHFRLRIPDSYQAKYELSQLNGAPCKLKVIVHDISAGGCRLFLPHHRPELKSGDKIQGQFVMGGKTPLPAIGEVRHVKIEDLHGDEYQFIGVQFIDMTPALESRLIALVMELHRQFFTRKDG
ncbi:MAG: PilZ domain-containing protein [Bdellovibrionaceae bacterium]|nr:PilZ domain-containing protein [Pseudobdellovibrionaceae bacterium]